MRLTSQTGCLYKHHSHHTRGRMLFTRPGPCQPSSGQGAPDGSAPELGTSQQGHLRCGACAGGGRKGAERGASAGQDTPHRAARDTRPRAGLPLLRRHRAVCTRVPHMHSRPGRTRRQLGVTAGRATRSGTRRQSR